MGLLDAQYRFHSLSLKDLLEARNLYHWQLLNRENVVGTAVGQYLIRKTEPHPNETAEKESRIGHTVTGPRTFENSTVRDYSWPCLLVLVEQWVEAHEFAKKPEQFIPPMLYLPDGRAVPVCVVQVTPAKVASLAPAAIRWPETYIGGGFPILANVQGQAHQASVGCLVTDGHKTFALTSRHVCGEPGTPIYARLRGQIVEIGKASDKQLTRLPFSQVYPNFPGNRTFSTLDIGLIDVGTAADWSSAVYGLEGDLGPVADLNELNIGLQLIEQPVVAFGSASGLLKGKIKGLFYRHKTLAGYDFVSDFLIAPDGERQTQHGDSGTVWHLQIESPNRDKPELRPIAVEWGGQGFAGSGAGRFNFALASGLSNACQLLDVDLVRAHDDGAAPFWGQTGHYSIATAAIAAVRNAKLKALLEANLERISFAPNELDPEQIRQKLTNGQFVELADVPDLVWKRTKDIPGGRDYARNAGPEHPNHYADIDKPNTDGETLRQLCLINPEKLDPPTWIAFYQSVGETGVRHLGLLPFRVWQFFNELVDCLKKGNLERFVCAAGILSHYVGDACQPLHGSYLSDGYKDDPDAKNWPGKGVHSTYEDKMVDRYSSKLLEAMATQATSEPPAPLAKLVIHTGRDAAFATIVLMEYSAGILSPKSLCDTYIALGGGSSRPVVDGLWEHFGDQTAQVMAAGAQCLATIWDAAYTVANANLTGPFNAFDESKLAAIYQDANFCPSLTLDKIDPVL